jgi:ribosome-associated protein
VADGQVLVDGKVETRKTAKIHAGQIVSFHDTRITVLPPDLAADVSGELGEAG